MLGYAFHFFSELVFFPLSSLLLGRANYRTANYIHPPLRRTAPEHVSSFSYPKDLKPARYREREGRLITENVRENNDGAINDCGRHSGPR